MQNTMKQVGNTKKLSAGGIGVALAVILFWALDEFWGVAAPAEVAGAGGAALTWFASLLLPDHMEA